MADPARSHLIGILLCLALIVVPLAPLIAMVAWWRHEQDRPHRYQYDAGGGLMSMSGFQPDASSCTLSPLDPGNLPFRTHPGVICTLRDVLYKPGALHWDRQMSEGNVTLVAMRNATAQVGVWEVQSQVCGRGSSKCRRRFPLPLILNLQTQSSSNLQISFT